MKDLTLPNPFEVARKATERKMAFQGSFVIRPHYKFNREAYDKLCANLEDDSLKEYGCSDSLQSDTPSMHTALMFQDARSLFKDSLARIQLDQLTVTPEKLGEYMKNYKAPVNLMNL